MSRLSVTSEIERYLRSGESDPHRAAWPGGILDSASRAHNDLRGGLVQEVSRLAAGRSHRPLPGFDVAALTRQKVGPMVHGLFAIPERDRVLDMFERAVVFVTSGNIEALLMMRCFDTTAWELANLWRVSGQTCSGGLLQESSD